MNRLHLSVVSENGDPASNAALYNPRRNEFIWTANGVPGSPPAVVGRRQLHQIPVRRPRRTMKCNLCSDDAVQFVLGRTDGVRPRHASERRCARHRINVPLHQKPDMVWQWREASEEEYVVTGVQES